MCGWIEFLAFAAIHQTEKLGFWADWNETQIYQLNV